MALYQLKIVVAEKKFDEFIDSLRFLSSGIRKEKGCLLFNLYRDLEKKDAYRLLGEWKTRQAMEAHFKREKFSVLIGAARVLGEDFEMSIGEPVEKGRPNIHRGRFDQKEGHHHKKKDDYLANGAT